MKRREFIKHSISTGIGIALSPMFISCAGIYRKPFCEITKGVGIIDSPYPLIQILGYAALSPSGHNTQPWIVKVQSQSELIIKSDKTRWLPEVDPTNREVFLSLAAFAETLHQASLAIGFDAQLNLIGNDFKDENVFQIKLYKTEPKQQHNLKLIMNRATTRTNYERNELSSNQIQDLTALSPDNIIYFPLQSSEGQWIAENLVESINQQTFDDKKQEELSHWLRFSKSEARKRGDGITAEALGMNFILRFIWYNLLSSKTAMGNSFRKKGVDIVREQVKNCAGFLILTSKDNSPRSLFDCGRLYQKTALKMTELSIVHHTMSQLLEETPWSSEIQYSLKLNQPIQFVIRLGYGDKAKPSIRRPVHSFVVF